MKLSELKAMKRTIPVRFGPHTISVTYRMDALTGSLTTRLVPELLALLDSWDLVDDDGTPVPITEDVLVNQVPLPFLQVVEQAIMKDAQPGNLNGAR